MSEIWAERDSVTRPILKHRLAAFLLAEASSLNELADRLLLVEQVHRPAAPVGDGGAGVDAEVVVERGEDVLE